MKLTTHMKKLRDAIAKSKKTQLDADLEYVYESQKALINDIEEQQRAIQKATEGFDAYLDECMAWIREQDAIGE